MALQEPQRCIDQYEDTSLFHEPFRWSSKKLHHEFNKIYSLYVDMADIKMDIFECLDCLKITYDMLSIPIKKHDAIEKISINKMTRSRQTNISKDKWELLSAFFHVLG